MVTGPSHSSLQVPTYLPLPYSTLGGNLLLCTGWLPGEARRGEAGHSAAVAMAVAVLDCQCHRRAPDHLTDILRRDDGHYRRRLKYSSAHKLSPVASLELVDGGPRTPTTTNTT